MKPIIRKISPFNHYKGGNAMKYIVFHDVGALGQVRDNLDYFFRANRGASADYFVDETEIGQSVEDYDCAWAVGDDKPNDKYDVGDLINNRNSIHIEMCLDKNWKIRPATKRNSIELCKYLQKKHNIPNSHVVRHHDASGKMCPLSMSGNNWAEWKAFYKDLTGASSVPTVSQVNAPGTHKVVKNDTLWGISKQYAATVAELKEWNNLKSDLITPGQILKLKKPAANKPAPQVKPPQQYKYNLQNVVYRYTKGKQLAQGEGVKQVQLALSSVYFYPDVNANDKGCDGFFGAKTADAIKRYQIMRGLKVDGVYGGETRAALLKDIKR